MAMIVGGNVALQQLERMGRELKCPICLSLFKQAAFLSCSHCFCKECILKTLKGRSFCPICKVPATRREVRPTPHTDNLVSIYRGMESAAGITLFATQPMEEEVSPIDEDANVMKKRKKPKTCENASKRKKRVQALQVGEAEEESNDTNVRKKKKNNTITEERVNPVGLNDLQDFETDLAKVKSWEVKKCDVKTGASNPLENGVQQLQQPSTTRTHASKKQQEHASQRGLEPFFWLSSQQGSQSEETRMTPVKSVAVPAFSDLKSPEKREPEEVTSGQRDAFCWTQRPCSPELRCNAKNDMMGLIVEDSQDPFLPIARFLENDRQGKNVLITRESKVAIHTDNAFPKKIITEEPKEASLADTNKLLSEPKRSKKNTMEEPKLAPHADMKDGVNEIAQTKNRKKNTEKEGKKKVVSPRKHPERNSVEAPVHTDSKRACQTQDAKKNAMEKPQMAVHTDNEGETKMYTKEEPEDTGGQKDISKEATQTFNVAVCAFCLQSNDSPVSGELMFYKDGVLAPSSKGNVANTIAVHKYCAEWAPDVYFTEDENQVRNLEAEVVRSQKLKCSKCGLKGAALGCCLQRCRRTYHYPCAKGISSCKWNLKKFIMLCPEHANCSFPGQRNKRNGKARQRQTVGDEEDAEVENVVGQRFPSSSRKLVLCGSALTAAEKEVLVKLASLTGATIETSYNHKVTHVIAGTDANGAARRTMKYLTAILEGKWIVKFDWVAACIAANHVVEEVSFEINGDIHGVFEGPKRGRMAASAKAAKLMEGMNFYFTPEFEEHIKREIQTLVQVGGGIVLHRKPVATQDARSKTFVVYQEFHKEAVAIANVAHAVPVASTWLLNSIAGYKLETLLS